MLLAWHAEQVDVLLRQPACQMHQQAECVRKMVTAAVAVGAQLVAAAVAQPPGSWRRPSGSQVGALEQYS